MAGFVNVWKKIVIKQSKKMREIQLFPLFTFRRNYAIIQA